VNELLEGVKDLVHLFNRRRHKGSAFNGAAWWANPILAAAKFPWSEVGTAHTLRENGMNLANQAQADGQYA